MSEFDITSRINIEEHLTIIDSTQESTNSDSSLLT
jgi:hypothetical protein